MAVRKAELAMLCFYDVRDFSLLKFFWKEGRNVLGRRNSEGKGMEHVK